MTPGSPPNAGRRGRCVAMLVELIAASCASSPPVQFFTLDPLPPRGSSEFADRGSAATAALQIARVRTPATLDRPEIVRETVPYTLEISDRHRWSAPLDQMFQRTLSLDLQSILPADSIVPPQEPVSGSTAKVLIDLDRFMPIPSGEVQLLGSWSVAQPDGAPPCMRPFAYSQRPESPGFADQVKAMSALIGSLAQDIAGFVRTRAQVQSACGH